MKKETEYSIKGPLGMGLGLYPSINAKNLSGTHVAFVGGTGIIPFLDLVGYLIRLNLGLIPEGNKLSLKADFKLVLFCSFREK